MWAALHAQGDGTGSIDTAFGKPLWRPKVCYTNPKRTPRKLQLCKIRPYCAPSGDGSGSSGNTASCAAARVARATKTTRARTAAHTTASRERGARKRTGARTRNGKGATTPRDVGSSAAKRQRRR